MENSNIFKVKLQSYNHGTSNTPTSEVTFDVMPILSESIVVDYQSIDPIHMPGSYYVYKGTRSSVYEIGEIKLVSRTTEEATRNQHIRNTIRGWTKPYFGFGTEQGGGKYTVPSRGGQFEYKKKTDGAYPKADGSNVQPLGQKDIQGLITNFGDSVAAPKTASAKEKAQLILAKLDAKGSSIVSKTGAGGIGDYVRIPTNTTSETTVGRRFLGAPPEVLYLSAYSSGVNNNGTLDKFNNINMVPVIITSFNYSYPNDVDYIPTEDGEPWPIIMTLTLSLTESHSAREFEEFDIFKYRDGILPGF